MNRLPLVLLPLLTACAASEVAVVAAPEPAPVVAERRSPVHGYVFPPAIDADGWTRMGDCAEPPRENAMGCGYIQWSDDDTICVKIMETRDGVTYKRLPEFDECGLTFWLSRTKPRPRPEQHGL